MERDNIRILDRDHFWHEWERSRQRQILRRCEHGISANRERVDFRRGAFD